MTPEDKEILQEARMIIGIVQQGYKSKDAHPNYYYEQIEGAAERIENLITKWKPKRLDNMLSTKEICEKLGVSRVTLWRWVKDPNVKFPEPYKVGRDKMWPESVIAQFFDNDRS